MYIPKILVVDDDTNILFAFHALLDKEGYTCVEANTAVKAFDKFTQEKPQAVFLDISLQDSDGLKVLRKMREENNKTPVIIMSSFENKEIIAQAFQAGAFEYIKKPVSITRIRQTLIKAMYGSDINSIKINLEKGVTIEY